LLASVFTSSRSGKVEYHFMDFGTDTLNFCFEGTGDCNPLDVRQGVHELKACLNFLGKAAESWRGIDFSFSP